MNLSELTDEQLVVLYKENNDLNAQNILFERYKKVAKKLAHGYYLSGGSSEDLIQVATIGISQAISSYNGSVPFKNYAYYVAKNAIFSEIKRSQNYKNKPLLNYVSFSEYLDCEDKSGIIVDTKPSPEEEIIGQDSIKEIYEVIKNTLSKFEYEVLKLFVNGESYIDIAKALNKSDVKSIDNAIQRIRKKLNQELSKLL